MIDVQALETLDTEQLRQAVRQLAQQLKFNQALIDKLTHENALLKRLKFAAQSERFTPEQRSLLEDEIEADLAAVALEIEQLAPSQAHQERRQPKRLPLPANLPRREIRHEPESTTCRCGCRMKRIGEDIAEKLDYRPGVFSVERHIRGKWACTQCETITQAPVAAHVIDKGIPTVSLLAQVLVAKYADHLPLYRQEAIFARAGLAIPRSTLAQWVGKVYDIERELKDATADERREVRQQRARPILEALHQWMTLQRQQVPGNSATAKALDYSLRRWRALTRFLDDGQLPVDNNWIENQIRPIAIGRNNWLFAGSLRAG